MKNFIINFILFFFNKYNNFILVKRLLGFTDVLNQLFFQFNTQIIFNKSSKKQIEFFLKKIFIYDVGLPLIRVGNNSDGGYILPDILDTIENCFSPGVGQATSFEDSLLEYNIKSFLIDATPTNFANYKKHSFIKKNLNSFNDENNITINKWLNTYIDKSNNKNILQIDIEGNELIVFRDCDIVELKRFSILVVEFHRLSLIISKTGCELYTNVLSKILENFTICHIHPNNASTLFNIYGVDLPKCMEITFVRNDLIKYKKKITHSIPHELDYDNSKNPSIILPEIYYK